MANYPNSVWSPSAKSAGQTIDASHINDIQDEVVAIEDGLRNATAPLASSRSTVATLSILGASTFAVRPVEPPPHVVRVALENVYELASSVLSTIAWTTQTIATNSSMHSTGTNPTRLTPQSTGVYRITAQVEWADNSSGFRAVIIRDSSGSDLAAVNRTPLSGAVSQSQASALKRFDALGGYAVVVVNQNITANITLSSANCWAEMEKL